MTLSPLSTNVLASLRDPDDRRLLIVAADPLTRAGLVALLNTERGITVVGQSGIESVAAAISAYIPDVIVWDAGSRLAQTTDTLLSLDDTAPILMLVTDADDANAIWLAGVRGIVLRSARIAEIVAGLTALLAGLTVLSPMLSDILMAPRDRLVGATANVSGRDRLTARETEVLQALTDGLPNKAIAHRLGISDSTVKFHINAIMGKLGAQSRTEAVVRATRLGLIVL